MFSIRDKIKNHTDEELMALIVHGREKALDELYRRYHHKLFYYFVRMLNNDREKARDFLQDVFMKIIENPRAFHPEKKFSTWIYAIAYNKCKNEYRRMTVRKNYREKEILQDAGADSGNGYYTAEKHLDHSRFYNALMQALETFDKDYQQIFVLRFNENFTIPQISEMTGFKEGTVKSRLHYMTKKLAVQLKQLNPYLTEVSENVK
jgi:RNA polymerase sigma-70 factor (ECF subfamily)